MARQFILIACFFFIFISIGSSFVTSGSATYQTGWMKNPTETTTRTCNGSIGECFGEDEMEMDSEVSRRILATTNYISYGALQRNRVPCSQRGASYYNCQSGGQANPYNRGCSAITQCRK